MELVTWRGTPGVGDFMWALNSVHNHCYNNNIKATLEFHWEHDEDYLHHFEDPETIIERLEYIHNFYHRKDDVTVKHVFGEKTRYSDWKFSDDFVKMDDGRTRIAAINRGEKNRFWFQSGTYTDEMGGTTPRPNWIFRQDAFMETDQKKVVVWTPTFNAEVPRTWKRILTKEQWDDIIRSLVGAGLYVVELSYRTPVREAMYHIATCRQIVCYDGMWHYIARNFCKPMIVVSPEKITKYHTPNAVRAGLEEKHNIFYWIDNISQMLGHSKKKAVKFEQEMKQFYE